MDRAPGWNQSGGLEATKTGETRQAAVLSEGELLLSIVDVIVRGGSLTTLFERLASPLHEQPNCDVLCLALYDRALNGMVADYWDLHRSEAFERTFPVEQSPCGWVWQNQEGLSIPDVESETRFAAFLRELRSMGLRSYTALPILTSKQCYGSLGVGGSKPDVPGAFPRDFLARVAKFVGLAVENHELNSELNKRQLRSPQTKPKQRSDESTGIGDIIGASPALKQVLGSAAIVAQTDATVLITGETGTGKELIARAIHSMSARRANAFIKMNCAAIPTGLLESELFGHEKGAFTGAISQKVGRLELADKGTLLLDEIGEIPMELQAKLLRVLQDQEFERLGGTKTIRVDVRVMAATNRDLERAVEERTFRTDLYYRLHVFPLHVPSLRERREDIPLLVQHLVQKCASRLNKRVDIIPDEAVEAMMNWDWPGNIRELENFIERSVILSDGHRLRAPLEELRRPRRRLLSTETTLRDLERGQIIEVLRKTRGVLSGPNGAAAKLGLKRTTLQSKIQKLGIARSEYLD